MIWSFLCKGGRVVYKKMDSDRPRTASMSTQRSEEAEDSDSPKRRRNTVSISDFTRRPSRARKKNKTVSCLVESVTESSNVYTQPAISQIIEDIKVSLRF